MDRKQKVLLILKPKVKQFGFNKKELQGIAAKIADNLVSADDASDEDVNAEIEEKIDAVLPYLQVSQSYANRLVEEVRKQNDDDEPDDDDDDNKPSGKRKPGSKNAKNNKDDDDDAPAWAKGLAELADVVKSLKVELTTLKGEKVATSRKSKLADLLKDSGSYGSRILKSFDRMKFETDEEFDDFYSEVEEDLKAYNQELADKGLENLNNPPAAGGKGVGKEDEPMSDKEIEDLANSY